MKLTNPGSEVYVPDGTEPRRALERTTHLGIAAHPDDLELMAAHGVFACLGQAHRHFAGVVLTDGTSSPRGGRYAAYNDEQMQLVRRHEQKKAAHVGEYGAVVMLDYPSEVVKDPQMTSVVDDLFEILSIAQPQVVYTHNLADKHDTHVATALRAIAALRRLPADARPEHVLGCEVWRDLDWLPDSEQICLDLSGHESLATGLLAVYDSQISGGKRYDRAAMGRRQAHATFRDVDAVDTRTSLALAMDLTPLIKGEMRSPREYVERRINAFAEDVRDRIYRMGVV